MPASVLLEGEYAQQGLHASVPVILGRNGVEEIVQLSLTDAEQAGFNKSCDVIREYIRAMHEML